MFLALLVPVAEKIMPFLTPGTLLLRPWTALMQVWPGAINMLLVSVANGLVFGAAAICVGLLVIRLHSSDGERGSVPVDVHRRVRQAEPEEPGSH